MDRDDFSIATAVQVKRIPHSRNPEEAVSDNATD